MTNPQHRSKHYFSAIAARVGDRCICGGCCRSFTKESREQRFCMRKEGHQCRDKYRSAAGVYSGTGDYNPIPKPSSAPRSMQEAKTHVNHLRIPKPAKCYVSGKNMWPSEEIAVAAHASITKSLGNPMQPIHTYECRACGAWHYSRKANSNVLALFGRCTWSGSGNAYLELWFCPALIHGRAWTPHSGTMDLVMNCAGGWENTGKRMLKVLHLLASRASFSRRQRDEAVRWYWEVLGGDHFEREAAAHGSVRG